MKWKIEQQPKLGDKRVLTKFALFPKATDNGYGVWLEKYEQHQEYSEVCFFDGADVFPGEGWVDVKRLAIISNLPWKD